MSMVARHCGMVVNAIYGRPLFFSLFSPFYEECLAHVSPPSLSLMYHPLELSQARLAPPLASKVSPFS